LEKGVPPGLGSRAPSSLNMDHPYSTMMGGGGGHPGPAPPPNWSMHMPPQPQWYQVTCPNCGSQLQVQLPEGITSVQCGNCKAVFAVQIQQTPYPQTKAPGQMATKRGRKKKDKPARPPRSPSAYNMFMKEEVAKVKSEHPELRHRDAFKMAAERWADSPKNPQNKGKPGFEGMAPAGEELDGDGADGAPGAEPMEGVEADGEDGDGEDGAGAASPAADNPAADGAVADAEPKPEGEAKPEGDEAKPEGDAAMPEGDAVKPEGDGADADAKPDEDGVKPEEGAPPPPDVPPADSAPPPPTALGDGIIPGGDVIADTGDLPVVGAPAAVVPDPPVAPMPGPEPAMPMEPPAVAAPELEGDVRLVGDIDQPKVDPVEEPGAEVLQPGVVGLESAPADA